MKTLQIIYIIVCIAVVYRAVCVPDRKKPFWRYWSTKRRLQAEYAQMLEEHNKRWAAYRKEWESKS